MFTNQDMFVSSARIRLENQFSLGRILASTLFESAEKILELNISVAKTSLEKSNLAATQLLTTNTPQDFFSLSTSQFQVNIEKILSYSRQLAAISVDARDEIVQATNTQIVATEAKTAKPIEKNREDVSATMQATNNVDDTLIKTEAKSVEPTVKPLVKIKSSDKVAKPAPKTMLVETTDKKIPTKPMTKSTSANKPITETIAKRALKIPPSKATDAGKLSSKIAVSKTPITVSPAKPIVKTASATSSNPEPKKISPTSVKKPLKK